MNLVELAGLTPAEIQAKATADPDWFREAVESFAAATEQDRKECQLAYYKAANPMASPVHTSTARELAIVGGNRSSKTDTMLAELAIQMTGHIPLALQATYPKEKIRAPIRARVVCNSLTDTLEPIIKPKLRWESWNGSDDRLRGHWGWIPKHLLKGGKWEDSYSEKYRTLSAAVDNYWVGSDGTRWSSRGYSTCQFMSYDQDDSAFEGTSLHLVCHDEIPKTSIYKIHQMRTFDTRGQIITGFTPPIIAGERMGDVSWFYDNVYERGRPGPQKHPTIESILLYTEQNTALPLADLRDLLSRLTTDEEREVRLKGAFLHLTGVIFKIFSAGTSWWCYKCQKRILPIEGNCSSCDGNDISDFQHVIDPRPIPATWPLVMVIDPHPRKPDAIGWFAITPSDDIVMIGEAEVDGTAIDVKRAIDSIESANHWSPMRRICDPNIVTETNDKLKRGWTIRQAYDDVGLRLDLANDEINTGIQNVNELLKPDIRTRRPRFQVFSTCERTIYSMTHWAWHDHSRQGDREISEKVRDRHKDYADLVRYLANGHFTFDGLARSNWQHGSTTRRGPRGY